MIVYFKSFFFLVPLNPASIPLPIPVQVPVLISGFLIPCVPDIHGEKMTIGLIRKKATLHVQHTFLYISLPLFCTTTTWNFQNLLSHTFYGRNVVLVLVHFFSLPLIFTLPWWPLVFLILSLPVQNSHVVLPGKKLSSLFFMFHSISLSPFLSLSFASLPPTFSCPMFQVYGHDY